MDVVDPSAAPGAFKSLALRRRSNIDPGTGKDVKGVARSGFPRALAFQNGSSGVVALASFCNGSRALMCDLAAVELCWKR